MEPLSREDILGIDTLADLRDLSAEGVDGRDMSQEEVTHILQLCDAVWLHPGDPSAPHAELHSGKCSDGFVDVLRALRFTNICSILAEQMVKKFGKEQKKN